MKNLAPGQYSWSVQRTGFTNFLPNASDPNNFLTLEKGQSKKGMEIKLTLQSAIAGRITDDDNEPVLDASITLHHHSLGVVDPPQGFYVKSACTADTDVMENGLDLSTGIPINNLEIVMSPEAAQLDGSVIDEKGNAVQRATVVLRPKNGRPWALALMRPVVTTPDGKFTIHSIAPGEYEILAFANVQQADALNLDLFQDYELQAQNLRLGPNSKELGQLKAITVTTQ